MDANGPSGCFRLPRTGKELERVEDQEQMEGSG